MITLSTYCSTFVMSLYFRGDRNGPLSKPVRRVRNPKNANLIIFILVSNKSSYYLLKIIVEGLGTILHVRQYLALPDDKKMTNHVFTETAVGRIRRKVIYLYMS